MATAGISTLKIGLGYALEDTAGERPTSGYATLTRINEIGGVSVEPEQIDASALEDEISRYIAGRGDTGGTFPITVNVTDETITEWTTLITAYLGRTAGKRMWFEIVIPGLTKAYFICAQPPEKLPMPDMAQNELLTVEINLTVEEYAGLQTKVALS